MNRMSGQPKLDLPTAVLLPYLRCQPTLSIGMRHWLWLLIFAACAEALGNDKGIGKIAPEWTATNWINSAPLELAKLRGKVVLARWWTAPDCRYCAATAPALNEFHKEFSKRGL